MECGQIHNVEILNTSKYSIILIKSVYHEKFVCAILFYSCKILQSQKPLALIIENICAFHKKIPNLQEKTSLNHCKLSLTDKLNLMKFVFFFWPPETFADFVASSLWHSYRSYSLFITLSKNSTGSQHKDVIIICLSGPKKSIASSCQNWQLKK